MKINYNVTGSERKQMVGIISRALEIKANYQGMPSMAYCIGGITIEKNGTMFWNESIDTDTIRKVTEALAAAGFESIEDTSELALPVESMEKSDRLTVSLPMTRHTGSTLRNLINLVYTRASLLNKALGTSFRVEQALTDALQNDACILTVKSLLSAVAAYEGEHGKALNGITITPEEISFTMLPERTDPDKQKAFTELVTMMNKQAINQNRVQAKVVNEENEKYAMRIWLTRLGMNGPKFKITRRVLMDNLNGHSAFRTPAEQERWQQRQAEKHEAMRISKAEEITA